MASIPSIGDILMLSQLAWKIGRAFAAGRTVAPAEFLGLETEINSLAKALKLLAETLFADAEGSILSKADNETQAGVATILLSCQATISDTDSLMDQYQVVRKHRTPGGFAIERSWSDLVLQSYKTMMWTTEGGNIQDLKNMLQMHISTITLTIQALQSKSLTRLESVVAPVAEKMNNVNDRSGSLTDQIDEILRTVGDIAGPTPQIKALSDPESRPPSSLNLDASRTGTPLSEKPAARDFYPPRHTSKFANPHTELFGSETSSINSSSIKRFSGFSFDCGQSTYSAHSGSYAASEHSANNGWHNPTIARDALLTRQASRIVTVSSRTPEAPEPGKSRDRLLMPPPLSPVTNMKLDPDIDSPKSSRTYHFTPRQVSDINKLHRSSTTASQKALFEREAFKNSAILCDVRGSVVEYTQAIDAEEDPYEVEMVEACKGCRICVVRKREANKNNSTSVMTSIWVLSDDNTVRMQQTLSDNEMYIPYSSYFSPEKISVTVPTDLKFHDVKFGTRPTKTARTHWINYVFDDIKASSLFQNELMGRTLLATFKTEKTLRIHEGISGAFTYQEQMCGMENLRIWEDEESSAVIALIHFSAQFRIGYFSFYLNSSSSPIRVKDEGGKEVKIKGMRVSLEKEGMKRKDSAVGEKDKEEKRKSDSIDKKRIVNGARIEFATEVEKRNFINLVKEVQRTLRELPDLVTI